MLRIYACIAHEHDMRLVLVAGLICFLAAMTAFAAFGQARARAQRHHAPAKVELRAAIGAGQLAPARLAAYEKLQAELAYERRREDPRAAQENRKLWASRHKAGRARTKQKRSIDE